MWKLALSGAPLGDTTLQQLVRHLNKLQMAHFVSTSGCHLLHVHDASEGGGNIARMSSVSLSCTPDLHFLPSTISLSVFSSMYVSSCNLQIVDRPWQDLPSLYRQVFEPSILRQQEGWQVTCAWEIPEDELRQKNKAVTVWDLGVLCLATQASSCLQFSNGRSRFSMSCSEELSRISLAL